MHLPFTGGCACRAIRYECPVEPVLSGNCHCRDCQRATGSAYASLLFVPAAAVRLSGDPRYYSVRADSGHTVSRAFCGECGSPVLGKMAKRPGLVALFAASLDDPSWHRPIMDTWTSSAQPWDFMDPALAKHGKGLSG